MALSIHSPDLLEACAILFGDEIRESPGFLHTLQVDGVRAAYRQRALETHPDRALVLGVRERELATRFQVVNQAYTLLLDHLSGRRPTSPNQTVRPRGGDPFNRPRQPDHFHAGTIPRRELLTGQYLFYAGQISWRTLLRAVLWQRRQRPRIGQIALNWGLLTRADILTILRAKSLGERFGDVALRQGLITPFEHLALLGRQRQLHRPIGEFFVDCGVLTLPELEALLDAQQRHNRSHRRR